MRKRNIGLLVGALFIGSAIWYYLKRWDRKNAWVAGLGTTKEERWARRDAIRIAREIDRRARKGGLVPELPILTPIAVGPLSGNARWLAMGLNRGWIKDNGDGTYQIHRGGQWQNASAEYAAHFVVAALMAKYQGGSWSGAEGAWATTPDITGAWGGGGED